MCNGCHERRMQKIQFLSRKKSVKFFKSSKLAQDVHLGGVRRRAGRAQRAPRVGAWWGAALAGGAASGSFCACPGLPSLFSGAATCSTTTRGFASCSPPGPPMLCPGSGLLPWGDPGALREHGQGWQAGGAPQGP